MRHHEPTFTCDFWRSCCCKDGGDGHCWGCGCPKSAHKDGDGFGGCRRELAAEGQLCGDGGKFCNDCCGSGLGVRP